MSDSPMSGSGLSVIQFSVDLMSISDWPPLFKQMMQTQVQALQSPELLNIMKTASGHTHGCFMQWSKATWLI